MTEVEILEKKELREQMVSRVDILDKVKKLFLYSGLNVATTKQVADYFSSPNRKDKYGNPNPQIIDVATIKKCYQRNKAEIDLDGTSLNTPRFWKRHFVTTKSMRGQVEFKIDENTKIIIPTRGIRCFSKRAILRIGMLLRDSDVAKEVRTQLLNTFEHSTDEQKTKEVNKELDIIQQCIGKTSICGTKEELSLAWKDYADYLNRNNIMLQNKNNELVTNNKALAGEILTWSNRASLNKAIRTIAGKKHKYIGAVWNDLYDELLYHHGIGLSMRGKQPYLEHLHKDEWANLIQSLTALCEEKYGISLAKIMEKSKLSISV